MKNENNKSIEDLESKRKEEDEHLSPQEVAKKTIKCRGSFNHEVKASTRGRAREKSHFRTDKEKENGSQGKGRRKIAFAEKTIQ